MIDYEGRLPVTAGVLVCLGHNPGGRIENTLMTWMLSTDLAQT